MWSSNARLYESQKIAVKYFTVAVALFGAQLLFGLIAAIQYLYPSFLFNTLDFSIARMVHINALVVWLLYAMIGSVYWLMPEETGIDVVGAKLANLAFYVLTAAVAVVVVVYIFVQVGPGNEMTTWLITEGREYIEAPRWADIGIVVVVLIFLGNVYATVIKAQKRTGIMTVLMADLLALAGLYLCGMFYTSNISVDQYWWWWVIHLWVEATWEVFVACVGGYMLMKTLGANRQVVEMWLWIEVAMMFGSGILGLGHHYFWIGTPEYWWEIGALFSALEPVPLVGLFVHVLYDWGKERGKGNNIKNTPAFAWLTVETFGNFLGAGVWGFMHTLPQINLYTHGTQWPAAHGHLAFFGAYAAILIGMFYMAVQGKHGIKEMRMSTATKWSISLITGGVLIMTVSLTLSAYVQTMVERGQFGATWEGYFISQAQVWFVQGLGWRLAAGLAVFVGFVLLVYDLITIAKKQKAVAAEAEAEAVPA
ncbi:cbb3-type cytochrome c oxidase subunit I [Nitrosophilus alvini]|uniref:cbb3-type cytochrome c oxidase subunit I n=1 Tax=Nitrosophilus alvini TaxID=2714855 RepID=UPI00190973E2|nr:cbb3-type cytochrome c oxidase subunit I [Nitrosophilus alvini]